MEHVLHAVDHGRAAGTFRDVDQAFQPQQSRAAMLGHHLEEEAERRRMQRLFAAQAEGVDVPVAARRRLEERRIVARAAVEKPSRVDRAVQRRQLRRGGIERLETLGEAVGRRVGEIGLGEHDAVGERRLPDRFRVRVERGRAGRRVHGRDHRFQPQRLGELAVGHQRVQDRRRVGQPGGLDDDALERRHRARGAPREQAEITVRPEGRIDLVLGTLSSGQGHETSFAQLLADWFSVDPAQVRLLAGDSDVATVGGGTHSGRSMRMGAAVMRRASDLAIEQGKQLAADLLEAAAADIEFVAGRFSVKGTDRSVGLFDVGALRGVYDESTPLPSFAYGSAVCEVEIDPQTGVVEVVRHANVDDCGRAINPLILHGQAHGGMAAGIGQALLERCVYEPESGQLQTATLMDYPLARADELPMFTTEISEVPSTTHPLGLRGGGEGGTTPALGAVANAIADALAPLGVEHVELPATPERVWRAIRDAKSVH